MYKLLAFAALNLFSSPAFADACLPLPAKAEKLIKAYADKIRGAEYCDYRDMVRGDIDADGVADLVVVFNVEGPCYDDKETTLGACGNNHESFMAAFLGKSFKAVPVLKVGSKGVRSIASLKIANGIVEAETLTYGKSDAMCCPSVKGKASFLLEKGVLTEKRL